jgi:hypothetical protein
MSPDDELRQHLDRVHGRENAHLLIDSEAEHLHRTDHDGGLPVALNHDPEWIGWTRADLEAATAETDDENSDEATGEPTNEDIEGPDPDLGKDLDDEDSLFLDGRDR